MIAQYVGTMIMALVVGVLQTSLLSFLGNSFYMDLLFIMVVMIGLFKDPVHGSVMVFIIGYMADVLSSGIAGLHMTSYLAVFFAAQTLKDRITPDTPLTQFTITLALGILVVAIEAILHRLFDQPVSVSFKDLAMMILGAFLNAGLAPVFYYFFRLVPNFIERPRGPRIAG